MSDPFKGIREPDRVDDCMAQLKAENERLREALRFYAEAKGYTRAGVKMDGYTGARVKMGGSAFGWNHPDRGSVARAALREEER